MSAGARKLLEPSFSNRCDWAKLTTRSRPRMISTVAFAPFLTETVPCGLIVMPMSCAWNVIGPLSPRTC
jgi:hypothetical protein